MSSKATRQDVAAAAGVSGATVSRVYNAPQLVDTATRERVLKAAEGLGFSPDPHASALRRGRSRVLLFVEIEAGRSYRWPDQQAYQSFYGEIVRMILHGLQETPFSFQMVSLESVKQVASLTRRFDFGGVLGFDVDEQETAEALSKLGCPVVCGHHGDHLTGVSTVTNDNREGGRLQARYLRERTDRALAYVTGLSREVRSHRLRREGFLELVPEALVLDDSLGFQQGTKAGGELAPAVRGGGVGAIACVNDLTALGVIQGLAAEGLRVPQDVPVMGYDNLPLAGVLAPGLPTVESHLPEIYLRAVELLMRLVREPASAEEEHLVLPPGLRGILGDVTSGGTRDVTDISGKSRPVSRS